MKRLRFERLHAMDEHEKLHCELIRLKINMEDYLTETRYLPEYSFHQCLERYLTILGKKPIEFARQISMTPKKLNPILTGEASPNLALAYRLERHSGDLIGAMLWWKLQNREVESGINSNHTLRELEGSKVHFRLSFS